MKNQIIELSVIARNQIWNFTNKSKNILKSVKGDVNYPLTVAMFSVIILVFGYPILKSIVTTIFSDIQTWWDNSGSQIFDEVVQQ